MTHLLLLLSPPRCSGRIRLLPPPLRYEPPPPAVRYAAPMPKKKSSTVLIPIVHMYRLIWAIFRFSVSSILSVGSNSAEANAANSGDTFSSSHSVPAESRSAPFDIRLRSCECWNSLIASLVRTRPTNAQLHPSSIRLNRMTIP